MSNIQTNVVKPEVKFLVNEQEYLLISSESETLLDSKIQEIEKFMEQEGKGKTDDEKNELYKSAQVLWKEYADAMKTAKYNFHLNRPQWKFLTDLLLTKLEYDVNTLFFAIELVDLLGSMRQTGKYTNDTDLNEFPVNATEITYIYHLISNHKVKGLTKDSFYFSEVLVKIGNISKLFNYYDAVGKNLSTEIQDWVAAFEDGVVRESSTVQVEVLEQENNQDAN